MSEENPLGSELSAPTLSPTEIVKAGDTEINSILSFFSVKDLGNAISTSQYTVQLEVELLVEMATTDPDPKVKLAAMKALRERQQEALRLAGEIVSVKTEAEQKGADGQTARMVAEEIRLREGAKQRAMDFVRQREDENESGTGPTTGTTIRRIDSGGCEGDDVGRHQLAAAEVKPAYPGTDQCGPREEGEEQAGGGAETGSSEPADVRDPGEHSRDSEQSERESENGRVSEGTSQDRIIAATGGTALQPDGGLADAIERARARRAAAESGSAEPEGAGGEAGSSEGGASSTDGRPGEGDRSGKFSIGGLTNIPDFGVVTSGDSSS